MKKIIGLGQRFGLDIENSKIIQLHKCKNTQCGLLTKELLDGLCFNCSYESKLNGGKK